MATEVTLIIHDWRGRSGQLWAELLNRTIEDEDGELVHADEEEV